VLDEEEEGKIADFGVSKDVALDFSPPPRNTNYQKATHRSNIEKDRVRIAKSHVTRGGKEYSV
jgi:hypothetical protein